MNRFLERAMELYDMLVEDRRYLHSHAEAGMELPVQTAYIKKRLQEMGIEPQEICDSGIVAVIGGKKPGKTILLRADFDALPMEEQTDLSFKSQTGCAHACGHDVHAAALLGAAKMLKECEEELNGCVKLMFQPGEEVFEGAKKMIEAGLMENPKPDAAMALHTAFDWRPGSVGGGKGVVTSSSDNFEIIIQGSGCHGAMPHEGIDPINVGVHIYQAFMELIGREAPPQATASLTFGQFAAGSTANIIPNQAVLKGTLRTRDKAVRSKLLERMHEITEFSGKMFRAGVTMNLLADVPSLCADPEFMQEMCDYAAEIAPDFLKTTDYTVTASEDFACVAELVPGAFFALGCRPEGEVYANHHPKVVFDEGALPYGAALHAHCAYEWLKANAQ